MAVLSACSTNDSMPESFGGMSPEQTGCLVAYGDTDYEIGPLGPSESQTVEPNSYASFRIGRTLESLVLVAERQGDRAESSFDVVDIPSDGVVIASVGMRDGGNPGYEVRCWVGIE